MQLPGADGIWQLRAHSWLLEEEDRGRVAHLGLEVIRQRDRFEHDLFDRYFDLPPAEMKAAAAQAAEWGYGPRRPLNPRHLEPCELEVRIEELWRQTLAEPGEESLERWIRQSDLAASGACVHLMGFGLPTFRGALLRGQLGLASSLKRVLFNDVTTVLQGGELADERARWFFDQGVVGVLMRWLGDGALLLLERQSARVEAPLEEGWPEQVARAALWGRFGFGRLLRDLMESDITAGVLEVGLPALTSGKGVGAEMGDWLLEPWWALGSGRQSQLICAMARRQAWPGGAHPMLRFELTTDDHELIQSWVLQHRCRLATGRWEFSPAWAFIPVIEQIFWLHGLIESEERGYQEHNGTQTGYAFEAITEHQADRPSRWVANAPKANELDWRIREQILPVVEELAREMAEIYGGHSELSETGERWAKVFYPWATDPEGFTASQLSFEEMFQGAAAWLEGEQLGLGEGTAELGERMLLEIEEALELEGAAYWGAAQGWNEPYGVNELLLRLETLKS